MKYDLEKLTKPLKVVKRIQETSDAVSLVFEVPQGQEKDFRFGPGQFLTLFLEIDGEVLPRSYSISSSPALDKELKVTIKRVPGGKGSNYIFEKIKEGQEVRAAPPAGTFYRPPRTSGPHHWLFIAAGSGITPVYSILKTVLLSEPGSTVDLIFANRNQSSIIYAQELKAWTEKMNGRLKIHHVLSQPNPGWNGHTGRCESALINKILTESLPHQLNQVEAYLCGPCQFMENFIEALSKKGLSKEQIHTEAFTSTPSSTNSEPLPDGAVLIGPAEYQPWSGNNAHLRVTLNGEQIELDVARDQTVLEALIESGANPPYSCLEGNCMACIAKVKSGKVQQRDPGILLDENMAAGETLTCQARPASSEIHITYDEI